MTMIKNFDDFVNEAVTPAILANTIKKCTADQLKYIADFKKQYKTELDKADKVVNVYEILDKASTWLVSKNPAMVQAALLNSPGSADKFIVEAYNFVYMEIQNQLKSIGTLKKSAIKLLAPSAADFDSHQADAEIQSNIYDLSLSLLNIGYIIGHNFYKSTEEDNCLNWDGAFTKSFNARKFTMIKNIKLLIRNFLYS